MSVGQIHVGASWESRCPVFVSACLGLSGAGSKKAKIDVVVQDETKQQVQSGKLVLAQGGTFYELNSALEQLVIASGDGFKATLLGATPVECAQVHQWMDLIAKYAHSGNMEGLLDLLNPHFRQNTYLAANRITLADLLLLHAAYPLVERSPDKLLRDKVPCFGRWFDSVQHSDLVASKRRSATGIMPVVDIAKKSDGAPPAGWALGSVGASSNSEQVAPDAAAASAAGAPRSKGKQGESKGENAGEGTKKGGERQQKGKKGKKAKKQGKPPKAAAGAGTAPLTPDTEDFFYAMDLRVGRMLRVFPHPDPDCLKIWCEEIDVGEDKPRQIASGIRNSYPNPEDLVGKLVVVAANLKARKINNFPSSGMVLCAVRETDTGKQVEVLECPADSVPGDRLRLGGNKDPVDKLLAPAKLNQVNKKKILQKFLPDFRTDGDGQVTWRDQPVGSRIGACRVPSLGNAPIS